MQEIFLKYKALLIRSAIGLVAATCWLWPQYPAPLAAELSKADKNFALSAFKAAKAGHWKQAERHTRKAKDPLPRKVLSWLRATAQNSKAPFSEIDAFLTANPHWPGRRLMRKRAEEAMRSALSNEAVRAWFASEPPHSVAGTLRLARALIAAGEMAEATKLVRTAWRDLDMTASDERDFRRAFRKLLRKEDHLARLDRLIWDQRIGATRRQMRRVDRDNQHLAQARLMLMRRTGGVDNAIARVPETMRNDPGLVYERLRWRRRKGFSDRAIELLQEPPTQLARPAKWWFERSILARRALRAGDISLSYRLVRDHKQSGGTAYAEAEWLAGWIALRFLRDYSVAYGHFQRLHKNVRYPISRARGAYWTARAIEADPDGPDDRFARALRWYRAAARYTTTFYGQLAINRLRQEQTAKPPPEPKPTPQQVKAFDSRELVRAVRLLDELRQHKLVKTFLVHLTGTAKTPADWTLIARLATQIERNDLAIRTAKLAIRHGVPLTVAGYPKLNVDRKFSVEPALIHAVVRQESAFDPRAISRAGARGLMQLMPATAQSMARALKVRHSKQKLTADPVHNIRLGSAYLDRLRDSYDGSLILTLAAYNAGPGNVRRWIKLNGDPRSLSTLDAIDWIEAIPVAETRNYVQRVLENLTIYGYRFDDNFLPEVAVDAMIGSDTIEYP